jgi:uncharacterized membrane-anchored protein
MNKAKAAGLVLFDSFIFASFIFICSIIASFICVPKAIADDKWRYGLNLALLVFILSIFMMVLSRKYSDNPVQNSRSRTPWTWWTLKK